MNNYNWESIGTESLSPRQNNFNYRKDSRTAEVFAKEISKSRQDEIDAVSLFVKNYHFNFLKFKDKSKFPEYISLSLGLPFTNGEVNTGNHNNDGDAFLTWMNPSKINRRIEIKSKVKYNSDRKFNFYFKTDSLKSCIRQSFPVIAILNLESTNNENHICTILNQSDLKTISNYPQIKKENHGNKYVYDVDISDFGWYNLHTLEPINDFIRLFQKIYDWNP